MNESHMDMMESAFRIMPELCRHPIPSLHHGMHLSEGEGFSQSEAASLPADQSDGRISLID